MARLDSVQEREAQQILSGSSALVYEVQVPIVILVIFAQNLGIQVYSISITHIYYKSRILLPTILQSQMITIISKFVVHFSAQQF